MHCPQNNPEHRPHKKVPVWFRMRLSWYSKEDPRYESPDKAPVGVPEGATCLTYLPQPDGWVYCYPSE